MRRILAVLIVPFLLSGCIPALVATGTETGVTLAENRSVGRKVDDTVIYTDLTNQFISNDGASLLTKVSFNIRYGRVMLTGIVNNQAEAQRAVTLTWKGRGVLEVINELVVSPERSYARIAEDSLTKRNLEARLLITKDVWVINYSMDVTEGTAYIIGRVKDNAELNRVLNVARTTRGVKRVVSHLQVNPDTQNGTTEPPSANMTQPASNATVVQTQDKLDPIDSSPIPPVTPNGGY